MIVDELFDGDLVEVASCARTAPLRAERRSEQVRKILKLKREVLWADGDIYPPSR
jgi:hypothetical protein